MRVWGLLAAAAIVAPASLALANDSTAQLGTGGLILVGNDKIEMASEDLSISTEQVRVVYEFKNTTDQDQDVLVAFPMPDIEGSPDFIVGIPSEDPENIFGFETTFDGEPVDAELHQYAFSAGIDQSELLRSLDVPLAPYGEETRDAVNALPKRQQDKLVSLGLVYPMEYSDTADGPMKVDYVPVWTLRSTYSWEAHFPANQTVEVIHTYKPSVGGTVAVTFMGDDDFEVEQRDAYTKKYCLDKAFLNAVQKTMKKGDPYSAPFTETWLSYIWSTGANWSGSVGNFTLTVDKGSPDNLVSFCGENIKKISPTKFQFTATDWFPPYDQELEILILNRMEHPPQ